MSAPAPKKKKSALANTEPATDLSLEEHEKREWEAVEAEKETIRIDSMKFDDGASGKRAFEFSEIDVVTEVNDDLHRTIFVFKAKEEEAEEWKTIVQCIGEAPNPHLFCKQSHALVSFIFCYNVECFL